MKNKRPKTDQITQAAIGHFTQQTLPEKIGRFWVDCLLYQNTTHDCYRCFDDERGQSVFIKLLNKGQGSLPTHIVHLQRESNILSALHHPYISKYIEHGNYNGCAGLVTQYYDGITLRQLLQEENPSIDEAYSILEQMAAALSYLHKNNIIHNDLKPENVLVLPSGSIRIVDFGIAQTLTKPIDRKVQQLAGTLLYMSPEQQDPSLTLSTSSDLYSFAIIAYELITGRLCHGMVKLASLPPPIQKIFAKALQTDPENRFSHPLSFMDELKAHKGTLSSKVSAQLRPIVLAQNLVDAPKSFTNPYNPRQQIHQSCSLPPHFWPLAATWTAGDSHEDPWSIFIEAQTTNVSSYIQLHQLVGALYYKKKENPLELQDEKFFETIINKEDAESLEKNIFTTQTFWKEQLIELKAIQGSFYVLHESQTLLDLTLSPQTPLQIPLSDTQCVWIFSSHTPIEAEYQEQIKKIICNRQNCERIEIAKRLARQMSESVSLQMKFHLAQRLHRIPRKVGVCTIVPNK